MDNKDIPVVSQDDDYLVDFMKRYYRIGDLYVNIKEEMNKNLQCDFGKIVLPSSFVEKFLQRNASGKKVLGLTANDVVITTVDIDEYPSALRGNRFFPFKSCSEDISFKELSLGSNDICVYDYSTFRENFKVSTGSGNDMKKLILVEKWNGKPEVLLIQCGMLSFPLLHS